MAQALFTFTAEPLSTPPQPSSVPETLPWPDLPTAALVVIFKPLPQAQRHACALVCKSWAEAAAAASDSIIVGTCRNTASLQLWLERNGRPLQKLHVHAADAHLTALPCPHLKDLLLPTAPDTTGLAAATAALQQLSMQATAASPDPELHPAPAQGNILQRLVQLERLELPGGLTDAALQHVSKLTKLHHLQLGHLRHAKPAAVIGLQQLRSLTFLQLDELRCNLSTSTVPPFSQLGKLQHLGLSWCVASRSMQPALLEGMTGLQVLSLQRVTLRDAAGAAGGADLLALLPQLQDLSALQLNNVGGMSDCHAVAFMSLTCSTALQRLCLTRLKHDGRGGGIWQHVFRGSGCGSLTELQLGSVPRLATGDVSAMVTCCPALQRLNITNAVEASAQLYPLRQLPGLTELTMHMYDTVATPSLAGLPARELWHLTGLRSLDTSCLTSPSSSSHFGIRQLTALQQLTSLHLTVAGGWLQFDDYLTGDNFRLSWAWSFFRGCNPNWSYDAAVSRSFQSTVSNCIHLQNVT